MGFACSIFAPCTSWLPGLILSIIALVRIRRDGGRGKGLAISGIIISAVWVLPLVGLVAVAIITDTNPRDEHGEIVRVGSLRADELRVGDCLLDLQDGSTRRSVPVTPCTEPHQGEVYAAFDLHSSGAWPGADAVFDEADVRCEQELARFPAAYDDPGVVIFYFHPTLNTWRRGDREVICTTYYLDGSRTGSVTR